MNTLQSLSVLSSLSINQHHFSFQTLWYKPVCQTGLFSMTFFFFYGSYHWLIEAWNFPGAVLQKVRSKRGICLWCHICHCTWRGVTVPLDFYFFKFFSFLSSANNFLCIYYLFHMHITMPLCHCVVNLRQRKSALFSLKQIWSMIIHPPYVTKRLPLL